jgi:hypothetical protein
MTDLKFSCLFVQNHAADRIPRHCFVLHPHYYERIEMCCLSIMINGCARDYSMAGTSIVTIAFFPASGWLRPMHTKSHQLFC